MSKSGKKSVAAAPEKSLLVAAREAASQGDAVLVRRLAQAVLGGKKGADDDHAALDLAKALSLDGAPVNGTAEGVAANLLERTSIPPKAYAFALLAAGVFLLLLTLASVRYPG